MDSYEIECRSLGYMRIAGIDEAGRGPLAGPVVAACVHIPHDVHIEGIADSKALTEKERAQVYEALTQHPQIAIGVGIVDAATIDTLNILQATLQAMCIAAEECAMPPDFFLIDGNVAPRALRADCKTVVAGDQKVRLIGAASIVAKHIRDGIMVEMHAKWPEYRFDRHKGYGTKAHKEALRLFGPSPIHRRSFSPVSLAAHTVQH